MALFFAAKCVNKVVDISKKSDRMFVITVLVQDIIASVIPQ